MASTFIDDLEKMVDLLQASMSDDNMTAYDEFLSKHDDVTENELDDTVKEINTETLADLYRQAENAYIEELNEKDRLVLNLYYYEGYNSREISKLLNKPESTIRTYLQKAKKMLRKELESYEYSSPGREQYYG